jgi:hypothetical protein
MLLCSFPLLTFSVFALRVSILPVTDMPYNIAASLQEGSSVRFSRSGDQDQGLRGDGAIAAAPVNARKKIGGSIAPVKKVSIAPMKYPKGETDSSCLYFSAGPFYLYGVIIGILGTGYRGQRAKWFWHLNDNKAHSFHLLALNYRASTT